MKGASVLYSSASQEWETPQALFEHFHVTWGRDFTFDAAASAFNAKCAAWSDNSLDKTWTGRVWCNPPYDRLKEFVTKGANEVAIGSAESVTFLIPARVDTKIWHDLIAPMATEVVFLKGRVKFGPGTNSAPFPSAVVTFFRGRPGPPKVSWETFPR